MSSQRMFKLSVLGLGLLSVGGCLVLEQLGWNRSGPSFSHRTHVEVEELECIDCHLWYEDREEPGFPRLKACMLCHEDFDEEAQPEARAAAFYEDGKYMVSRVNALDLEVSFSHVQHAPDEESCADCHEAVIESNEVRPWMAVTMGACVKCHEATGEPVACDSCHEEIRVDTAPRTHEGGWDQFHGLGIRNSSQLTVDRCDMCHQESTCTTCHQEQLPRNHNNYWRRRAHGLTASLDRQNCAACHTPNYCDRCHTTAEPQSHNGLWGGTKSTHCLSCHTAGGQQSCSTCHINGAPSHQLAPPQPVGHIASSDCRSCHLILKHVDNGTDCNSCHN